jgi:phage shock protein PspC (stress-responsive transcriptional regulator)
LRGEGVVETIGVYKDVPLTVDPVLAVVFAAIGWLVVLTLVFYSLHRWWKAKKPAEVAGRA